MLRTQLPVALLLLSVLSASCTENGSPVGAAPLSDGGGASAPATGINGPHTGEIWSSDAHNGAERFNVQTGKITKVSETVAFPTNDGSKFVEYFHDHDLAESVHGCINWDEVDLVNVKDTRSGSVLSSFKVVNRGVRFPVRPSPDGERLALFLSEQTCRSADQSLTRRFSVLSTNGELLYRNTDEMIRTFDWHPDGRLVLVRKMPDTDRGWGVLIESRPGSYEFDYLFTYDAQTEISSYTGLRVGPTGNDAVIEAVSGNSNFLSGVSWRNGEPFHFPLFEPTDGEIQLFRHNPGDTPRVNSPVFSPDGQHVLVTEGYSQGTLAYNATFPELDVLGSLDVWPVAAASTSYIVSASVKGQLMPPTQYSDSIRPVLINQGDGTVSTVSFDPRYLITWTPVID